MMITVHFSLERQTKGALRYMEVDGATGIPVGEGARVGTLYVRKSAFADPASYPQKLVMRLEAE